MVSMRSTAWFEPFRPTTSAASARRPRRIGGGELEGLDVVRRRLASRVSETRRHLEARGQYRAVVLVRLRSAGQEVLDLLGAGRKARHVGDELERHVERPPER